MSAVAIAGLGLALPGSLAAEPVLPLPAEEAERRLRVAPFQVLAAKRTSRGVTGAHRIRVQFEDGVELDLKWKPAPSGDADGWNNSPRKELAAVAAQALFLEPEAFVVPPSAVRCLPLAQHARIDPDAGPQIPESRCVVGLAALWLSNVTTADRLLDEERIAASAAYARSLGDLNLLTILIDHRDGRNGNFLERRDPPGRLFSVDNGVSFGDRFHNYFVRNWNVLRVDRLPASSVARLRALDPAALRRLGVLVELAADADGVLQPAAPTAPWAPERGARVRPGGLQLGLSRSEIEGMAERLQDVLERVDAGDVLLLPSAD